MSKRLIAALILIAVFVAIRVIPVYAGGGVAETMANISPLAALALCGGMLLPLGLGAALTFGAFLLSDVLINLKYGEPILNWYSLAPLVAFAAIFLGGYLLRKRRRLGVVLGASVGATLLFYLVTNTASMFYNPAYPKTFAGWWQSVTVGVPGFVPTWVFGLRSLAGNLVFAAAFYLALRPRQEQATELAPVPAA